MLVYSQRDFINEICEEEGIILESLSQGYVLCLTKNGATKRIFGSYWDINSAASDRIACDKSACYLVLDKSGIPAIAHELLYNPLRRIGYAGAKGAWTRALDYFETHNRRVVLKPNQGTKGKDVYYCDSIPALEAAAQAIFANHPDAALSPYSEIETEYRVYYLAGECPFAYGKAKGNNWQHNLSLGATAFEITEPDPSQGKTIAKINKHLTRLKTLATIAAECIGITFATIDIAQFPTGELSVMEINSGVQARQLLEQLPHLRPVIKNIYSSALRALYL